MRVSHVSTDLILTSVTLPASSILAAACSSISWFVLTISLAAYGIDYVLERNPSEHPVADALYYLAAFDEVAHGYALDRSAVVFLDHYVLRDVDEPPVR